MQLHSLLQSQVFSMRGSVLHSTVMSLCLLSCAFTGSASTSSPEPVSVPSTIPEATASAPVGLVHLVKGGDSGIEHSFRLVVRDTALWHELWTRHVSRAVQDPPPAPPVRFTDSMVVVVAMGRQASSGHGIEVTRAEARGDVLRIHVLMTRPGPRCLVTTAVTRPVDIVRLPSSRFVEFRDSTVTTDCSF